MPPRAKAKGPENVRNKSTNVRPPTAEPQNAPTSTTAAIPTASRTGSPSKIVVLAFVLSAIILVMLAGAPSSSAAPSNARAREGRWPFFAKQFWSSWFRRWQMIENTPHGRQPSTPATADGSYSPSASAPSSPSSLASEDEGLSLSARQSVKNDFARLSQFYSLHVGSPSLTSFVLSSGGGGSSSDEKDADRFEDEGGDGAEEDEQTLPRTSSSTTADQRLATVKSKNSKNSDVSPFLSAFSPTPNPALHAEINTNLRLRFLWGREKKSDNRQKDGGESEEKLLIRAEAASSFFFVTTPSFASSQPTPPSRRSEAESGSNSRYRVFETALSAEVAKALRERPKFDRPHMQSHDATWYRNVRAYIDSAVGSRADGNGKNDRDREKSHQGDDSSSFGLPDDAREEEAQLRNGHFDVYPQKVPISPFFRSIVAEIREEIKRGTLTVSGSATATAHALPPASPLCLPNTDASVYRMPPAIQDRNFAFQRHSVQSKPAKTIFATAPSIILEAPMGAIALFSHAPMSLRATRAMLRDPYSALTPPSVASPENKREDHHDSSAGLPHIVRPKHRKALRLGVLMVGGVKDASLKALRSIRENVLDVHNSIAVATVYYDPMPPAAVSTTDKKAPVAANENFVPVPRWRRADPRAKLPDLASSGRGGYRPLKAQGSEMESLPSFSTKRRMQEQAVESQKLNEEKDGDGSGAFRRAAATTRRKPQSNRPNEDEVSGGTSLISDRSLIGTVGDVSRALGPYLAAVYMTDKDAVGTFVRRFKYGMSADEKAMYDHASKETRSGESLGSKKSDNRLPLMLGTEMTHHLLRVVLADEVERYLYESVTKAPSKRRNRYYHLQRLFRLSLSRFPWTVPQMVSGADALASQRYFRVANPIWDYGRNENASLLPALPLHPRVVLFSKQPLTNGDGAGDASSKGLLDFLSSYRPFYGARVDTVILLRTDLYIPFPVSMRIEAAREPLMVIKVGQIMPATASANDTAVTREEEKSPPKMRMRIDHTLAALYDEWFMPSTGVAQQHAISASVSRPTVIPVAVFSVHCSCHPDHCDAKGDVGTVRDVAIRDAFASSSTASEEEEIAASTARARQRGSLSSSLSATSQSKYAAGAGEDDADDEKGGGVDLKAGTCSVQPSPFSSSYPLRPGSRPAMGRVVHEIRLTPHQVARPPHHPLYSYYPHPVSDLSLVGVDGPFLDASLQVFENLFVADYYRRAGRAIVAQQKKKEAAKSLEENTQHKSQSLIPTHVFTEIADQPSSIIVDRGGSEWLLDESFALTGRYWAGAFDGVIASFSPISSSSKGDDNTARLSSEPLLCQRPFYHAVNVNDERFSTDSGEGAMFFRRKVVLRGGQVSLSWAQVKAPLPLNAVLAFLPHSFADAASSDSTLTSSPKREDAHAVVVTATATARYPPEGIVLPIGASARHPPASVVGRRLSFVSVPREHMYFSSSAKVLRSLTAVDRRLIEEHFALDTAQYDNDTKSISRAALNVPLPALVRRGGDQQQDAAQQVVPAALRTGSSSGGGNDGGITVPTFGWCFLIRADNRLVLRRQEQYNYFRLERRGVAPWNRYPLTSDDVGHIAFAMRSLNVSNTGIDKDNYPVVGTSVNCVGDGSNSFLSHGQQRQSNAIYHLKSSGEAAMLNAPYLHSGSYGPPPIRPFPRKVGDFNALLFDSRDVESSLLWFPAMDAESPFFTCQPQMMWKKKLWPQSCIS